MRKLLIILLCYTGIMFAQVGNTDTPYETEGWSEPAEYTDHYQFAIYQLLSNPGGWINLNLVKIDSLLNELIVLTNYYQMYIRNDTLMFSDSLSGKGAFSGTDTSVTVNMPDVFDSSDVIIITSEGHGVNASTLSVYPRAGEFDVRRPVGGFSGEKFNWIWIRKW
jgi:hypothetical protein